MKKQFSPNERWGRDRSIIENLIDTDDSQHWENGLKLMIPYMDKVYQDRTGKKRDQYRAIDIVYISSKVNQLL